MMDTKSILSRRAMLKASSFFAGAVAIAPAVAVAAPAVPDVLAALLREYAGAADGVKKSNERFHAARRQAGKAVEEAALYFQWPDGDFGRIGDSGNAYHAEYALAWLKKEQAKRLDNCADAMAAAEELVAGARTARQIRRLGRRYDAIVAATDYHAANEADTQAYHRFTEAREALQAYRPDTMAEVAAIIRSISAVGPYPGTHNGINVRDLADMLSELANYEEPCIITRGYQLTALLTVCECAARALDNVPDGKYGTTSPTA